MNPCMAARWPFFCLQNNASMLDFQLKPHTNGKKIDVNVTGRTCSRAFKGSKFLILNIILTYRDILAITYYCFDMAIPIKSFVHNAAEKTGLCLMFIFLLAFGKYLMGYFTVNPREYQVLSFLKIKR